MNTPIEKGINMIIQISSALKHPGQSFPFSVGGNIENIDLHGEIIVIKNPIDIDGTIMYTGEDFFVRGSILVDYTAKCGLCSQKASGKVDCDFNEEFCIEADLSHPDRFTYVGNTIDITKMVTDNICLNLPLKHLCEENCKGLCPECGQNLNKAQCKCSATILESDFEKEIVINKKDNPFAVLENLVIDEEEEA